MDKLTIDDVSLKEKKVLMPVDFNVPVENGLVTDDTRIRATLPTLQKILKENGKAILMSHFGRPKGGPEAKYSLAPTAKKLSELISREVKMAPDCVGGE